MGRRGSGCRRGKGWRRGKRRRRGGGGKEVDKGTRYREDEIRVPAVYNFICISMGLYLMYRQNLKCKLSKFIKRNEMGVGTTWVIETPHRVDGDRGVRRLRSIYYYLCGFITFEGKNNTHYFYSICWVNV